MRWPGGTGAVALTAEIDAGVQLAVSLGRVAATLERQARQQDQLNQLIYPVDIPPVPWQPSTTILDLPDLFGPKLGTIWDIRRLVLVAAQSSGSVIMYRNSPLGDVLFSFTISAAGAQTQFIPAKGILLRGGERAVFVSSGSGVAQSVSLGGLSIDASILGLHLL